MYEFMAVEKSSLNSNGVPHLAESMAVVTRHSDRCKWGLLLLFHAVRKQSPQELKGGVHVL